MDEKITGNLQNNSSDNALLNYHRNVVDSGNTLYRQDSEGKHHATTIYMRGIRNPKNPNSPIYTVPGYVDGRIIDTSSDDELQSIAEERGWFQIYPSDKTSWDHDERVRRVKEVIDRDSVEEVVLQNDVEEDYKESRKNTRRYEEIGSHLKNNGLDPNLSIDPSFDNEVPDKVTDEVLINDANIQAVGRMLYELDKENEWKKNNNAVLIDGTQLGSPNLADSQFVMSSVIPEPKDGLEYGRYALESLGFTNWNITAFGLDTAQMAKAEPWQRVAFYYGLHAYEQLKNLTRSGTVRAMKGIVSDPSSWAGLGTLGLVIKSVLKGTGKQLTRKAWREALKKVAPIAAGSVEGGAYTAIDDYFRQKAALGANAQEEFDLKQLLISLGMGVTVGAAIPGAVQAAPAVIKAATDLGKRVELDDSATLGSTRIPIRLRPKETKGLNVSKDITEVNLRKHNKRLENVKKDIPYPGGPKNERTILKSDNKDLPEIAVGEITFDDWIKRINSTSTKKQIMEDKDWYDRVFPEFERVSGGDKEEMCKLAEAWFSASQNETPANALTNVLFIFEQFKKGVPRSQAQGKGLPTANKIATDIIYEEKVTGGFGQKIADFIDSGYRKNTRSIMGNDPSMSPFVIDIHSARDLGFTDPEYINHLQKLGYKLPDDLKLDTTGGGIKDTKYENRAKFGRDLTDYLNSINWQGKSDWVPQEIQAIGWMNMTRLYSGLSQSGDIKEAFSRNLRRVSMEVDPGEGSPWQKQFGDNYSNLNDVDKININNIVTAKAIEKVNKQEGIVLGNVVHGTGGWELYQNPSTVSQVFSSKEAAIRAGAKLGYLLNQTEVWVNTSKELTKNPKHYGVDIIEKGSTNLRSSDELKNLFQLLIENDPNELFRGYQPIVIEGQPGIKIIIDNEAIKNSPLTKKEAEEYIISFTSKNGKLNQILQDLNFDVETAINEVELDKLRNNWKEEPNGEGYKKHYSEKARGSVSSGSGTNIDNDRVELTNIFAEEIDKASGRKK